jgi:hypothetical protein
MGVSCLLDLPTCAGSALSTSIAHAILSGVVSWIAGASAWVWNALGFGLSASSSAGDITSAATPEFHVLAAIAPLVALCALVATVISALRRADAGSLVRDVLLALPLLTLAVVAAIPFATLILDVVNGLSQAASVNASSALTRIAAAAVVAPASEPGFAVALLDFVGILAAIVLWFELVVRDALLSLLICISPLVFAAAVWPPLRRLAVRLVETFVAVALTKVVVVIALALGASAIFSGPGGAITGIALVLLATLSPFVLLRVIPFLEGSAAHAADGVRQRAVAAAGQGGRAAANGLAMALPAPIPGPPEHDEDMGLEWWPSSEMPPLPEVPDTPPDSPVGTPTVRHGHVAMHRDEHGPVIGWHWDD